MQQRGGMVRRAMPAARSPQKKTLARQLKTQWRNSRPYTYYDSLVVSASAVPPAGAAFNFAQFTATTAFFNTRTEGNAGLAITNSPDSNKLEEDFLCKCIAIDVHCDVDAPSAAGISTAQSFVECMVYYGAFALWFGPNRIYSAPVVDFPGGGGMITGTKIRTQGAAANSDSADANNGLATAQARRFLEQPILFERGGTFRAEITVDSGTNGTLARLQAIQALTGVFKACVKVKLQGIKGERLLPGVPVG